MKNTEFKVTKSKNQTVFTLESATGGGTSAGSVASVSNPVGGVRRRVSNLVTSEAGTETVTVPVTQKPRQGPLKPQTGAGAHRDKKKEQKQGQVKHKKPYIEDHSDAANRGWGAGSYDTYANTRHGRGVAEGISGLGYDAQSLITKLRRDVEEKRLRPTPEAILAAARELAGDMEFAPQLLVKQVLGQGVAEDHRDNPMYGQDADFDNMLLRREARRKGMTVAQYKNYLEKQKQDQDHELNIGSAGRAELKQKADELAEIKREKLRNERLHDEEVAFQRAETVQQRKDEMQKIADKYRHDLTVIDKEHRNNMEAIRTGNSHETNKMSMEFQHEKEMWDRNNSQQKPQSNFEKPIPEPEQDPEDNRGNNFDQDTGATLRPQSNQWHTHQQVGYKPTKPTKPSNNDDIVDIEPKPNKPLSLKEKITVVKDPAKATGIQQTGGITHGSVYAGKPLPQSLQQKLDGKTNTGRAVDAKGRTQQQWVKLVKAKFPDAKIMQAKMIDGPVFAMLPDGRKLSWNKVEQGVEEGSDGRDKHYYLRNNIWRVMDGDELVHEYTPDRYEVVGAKKLLSRFDDEGYDVTHVISPMGTVTYLYGKPEDDMDEGVAEGPNDGKEDNFTIDDIKRLEKIRDLETLKAQAKELIKGKPARRMKPEKISWFYNHIDTLRNPLAVIKMMYDLMLAGEGNKVIGSRNSMSSNSYRTRFGEDHEIQMASSELQSIAKNAEHLLDLVRKYSEQEGLQAWQQSKITKAADYLNSVLQSINGEQSGMEEARNNYHANTTGFGRRPRDDERHDLDTQTDPSETMMWNLTIDGKPLNPEPIMGRSNLIKFGKQQAAAGVDLSNAMISPVKNVEEDAYMMELASKLAEKIPSNAPVDAWIQDFQQANPEKYHQFRQNNQPGTKKPEAKIAQMAVAASYAAKNPSKKK